MKIPKTNKHQLYNLLGPSVCLQCSDSDLIFRCDAGTLGADLIANGGDRVISLDVKRRVKLTGAELEEHIKKVSNE